MDTFFREINLTREHLFTILFGATLDMDLIASVLEFTYLLF